MRLLTALILCAYLLFDSGAALLRAREAMSLWASSVAPALFPFLALLPALTDEDALHVYEKLFGKGVKRLFHISGASAAPALVGLIAGSPAGSLAVVRAYQAGAISQRDARVLTALATGVGPVFVISSVGGGMMNDVSRGVVLLISAWLSSFLTAILVSRVCISGENLFFSGDGEINPPGAIREAVIGILTVAGYMTAFYVFAGGLPDMLYAFFEISGGCRIASERNDMVLSAAVIGFGGACLMAQNIRNLQKTGVKAWEIAWIKAFTGALSALLCALISDIRLPEIRLNFDAYRLACLSALFMTLFCALNRLLRRNVRVK
ncbi:MAG: hypothetical protein IKJ65_04965 [Clostridia bacterium]|nr:hypothetical protein [Clostridia bacterium]